jgi:hypothetical protein
VCGEVVAVGPIVLGVGPAPATTTTTLAPGATTTTTVTLAPGGSTTTSTTLPVLPVCDSALGCLDAAIAAPLCPGETINAKLAKAIARKLAKAHKALTAARGTDVTKKAAKLVAKAARQLAAVGTKADAFVAKKKGPISPGCRDSIRAAIARVAQQIDANRI